MLHSVIVMLQDVVLWWLTSRCPPFPKGGRENTLEKLNYAVLSDRDLS